MNEKEESASTKDDLAQKVRCAWGRGVASAAIHEMTPKTDASGTERFSREEINAFCDECKSRGEDVIGVVLHIAKRDGIDLAGNAPEEEDKKRLWHFLRGVIEYWVDDFSSFVDRECNSGEMDWRQIIKGYVNDRIGKEMFKVDDDTPKKSLPYGCRPVNKVGIRRPRCVVVELMRPIAYGYRW